MQMNPVARSAIARSASFVPTSIATLLTTRLVIGHFGVSSFNAFILTMTTIALIPLNDLGVGAAVTSNYAARGPYDPLSRRATLTALRTLAVSTAVLEVANLALTMLGLWPTILGRAAGPNGICGLAVAIYGLSFAPGLAQSALLGTNRNHVTILVQAFFTPLTLALVAIAIYCDLPRGWVILTPSAAVLLISLATAVAASRMIGLRWASLLAEMLRPRKYPGTKIRHLSGPRLMITLTAPVTLQGDRVILSQVATAGAVADYSVAGQLFAPIGALIAAAATPLWPIFDRARASGRGGPSLVKLIVTFVIATLVGCIALVLLADPLGILIGGGRVHLGLLLPVAWALVMVGNSASYVTAMSMMDVRGIRFVGICSVIGTPIGLALSVVLARRYGAPGPLFATAVSVLVFVTIPMWMRQRFHAFDARHRREERARSADAESALSSVVRESNLV